MERGENIQPPSPLTQSEHRTVYNARIEAHPKQLFMDALPHSLLTAIIDSQG